MSVAHATSSVTKLVYILAGAVLAAILCFFVLPVLSIILWFRGLFTVVQYVQQVRRKKTPWGRRQVDLGEEEEWSIARAHAITRNRRCALCRAIQRHFGFTSVDIFEEVGRSRRLCLHRYFRNPPASAQIHTRPIGAYNARKAFPVWCR